MQVQKACIRALVFEENVCVLFTAIRKPLLLGNPGYLIRDFVTITFPHAD